MVCLIDGNDGQFDGNGDRIRLPKIGGRDELPLADAAATRERQPPHMYMEADHNLNGVGLPPLIRDDGFLSDHRGICGGPSD